MYGNTPITSTSNSSAANALRASNLGAQNQANTPFTEGAEHTTNSSGVRNNLERFTRSAERRNLLRARANPAAAAAAANEMQVFSARPPSLNTTDEVRIGVQDLLRPDPEFYGDVQAEQSEKVALRDLQNSGTDMPVEAKGQIFGCAGSDYMMIVPKPDKPAEKVAPLEGNGAGTAGTKGWAECTQNLLLKPAHACGEALLKHGQDALAIVVASGKSKLPDTYEQVKARQVAAGRPAHEITPATIGEDTLEKLTGKSSFDKFSAEQLGRQAPTRYSHEKFYHVVSGMCDPLRHAYGPQGYEPIAYLPENFESKHVTGESAHWTTNAKPTVMAMQMGDSNSANGWSVEKPNAKGEYELHFHGRKVNVFYNDGGLGQLLATIAEKMGVAQIKINPAECRVVNPTIEMATDKFQWVCAHNDLLKTHGHLYPVMVQQVPAFFAKNDTEIQQSCQKLVDAGIPPILKPDNSRWGYGIKPMAADASPEVIQSKIAESRAKLNSTINLGGKNIAGRTYCVTEAYTRFGATFEKDDKREACHGFGIELRCAAIGDYDKAYAAKPAGAKLRSQLAIAKLAPLGAETGNLSDTSSSVPTNLLTLPMNESGMTSTGLTQVERDQVVRFNTHLWSHVLANQEAYQFDANGEPKRTDALADSPVALKNVPPPR